MARDTLDDRRIDGRDTLIEWIAAGCKPRENWRLGTEHEKFPFHLADGAPVSYEEIGRAHV